MSVKYSSPSPRTQTYIATSTDRKYRAVSGGTPICNTIQLPVGLRLNSSTENNLLHLRQVMTRDYMEIVELGKP
jgi:hypothetical protein